MLPQRLLVTSEEFKKAFEGITVFGVAGSNASGKDTIMKILSDSGYLAYNAGDALREITLAVMSTTRRGGNDSPTGKIANYQRQTYPGGMVTLGLIDYWARILHLPKEYQPKGLVVGSIRSVSEVQALHEIGGKLIVTDADAEIRYKRIISRSRDYETNLTFEEFLKEEEGEMAPNETDPKKFGMAKVIEMADILIENNFDSFEEFQKKTELHLEEYLK